MSDKLIELYKMLISIPSPVGNEAQLARYIGGVLGSAGFRVDLQSYGSQGRLNVVAKASGSAPGPRVLFSGHLDTVPVHNGWESDPFTPIVKGDRIYGLGACDMKGGLAAMIEAASAFIQDNPDFPGELVLAFTSDEEGESEGTYSAIQAGLLEADMAVVGECHFNPLVLGFRGRYCLELTVQGKPAHASVYPDEGDNALLTAAKLAIALEELPVGEDPRLGRGGALLRYLSGGEPTVITVPDRATLVYDRYVVPGETQDGVWAQVEGVITALGLQDKVSMHWRERKGPFLEGFALSGEEPIVQAAVDSYAAVMGEKPVCGYDPSVCDSSYLAVLLQIPVLTFGPSGGNWHKPNEYGLQSQVVAAAKVYYKILQNMLC